MKTNTFLNIKTGFLVVFALVAVGFILFPVTTYAVTTGSILINYDYNGRSDTDCEGLPTTGDCVAWRDGHNGDGSGTSAQFDFCLNSAVKYASGLSDISGLQISYESVLKQPVRCMTQEGNGTYASYRVSFQPVSSVPLNVSCSVSPNPANVNQTVNFFASATGGTGTYSYIWAGGCSGSSANCATSFSTSGPHSAGVSVISGSQSAFANCLVNVNQQIPNLNVSCSANPSSIQTGQSSTFTANATGGTGSYTYSWSGACTGSGLNCSNTFNTAGTKTATVTVASGNQTASANCSVTVNQSCTTNSYRQCYNNDVYWYDSCNNRQGLYQSCPNGCSNGVCNNVQNLNVSCSASPNPANTNQTVTFSSSVTGGTGSNTYSWSGACTGSSLTCSNSFTTAGTKTATVTVISGSQTASANCSVSVTQSVINHDHRACYNDDVYWYDSNNNRNDIYQDCGDDVWTSNYQCSGSWLQRQRTDKGCSNATCFATNSWLNYQDCSLTGQTCQNNICYSNPTLNVSCSASPNPANTNQTVTFSSSVTGGTGSNTYSWSGACTGSSLTCSNSFTTAGTQNATVTVTSGTQTGSANCSVVVNQSTINHHHRDCYNNDVYWYDSNNNRNDIYQDCGEDGWTSNYQCSGNWLQHQMANRGCSNAACYETNTWSNYQYCSQGCQNNQCISYSNLNVSCSATPNPADTDQRVTFRSYVSGGTGSNTYSWSGACSGSSSTCHKSFSNSGTKNAYLDVTSGSQTGSASCSVNVNQQQSNRYLSCYSNDVYWYDSQGNRQEIYQDCGESSCDSTGYNYCEGNSVYQRRNCYSGGCAGSTCYNTGTTYNNTVFIRTCGSGQTCQNGYCTNNQPAYIIHSYNWCYNGSVYWYDSNNTRQDIYQTCSSDQTCQTSYCMNNSQPTPTQYKGCYNSDIYWFSSSTNVRLNFFQSCQDQNSCTLDSCANARCSNALKCDGTTCSNGSADYCSNCNHAGDGTCNCGETINSDPQDCGIIGLALTLFGKKENDSVEWSKNFTAVPNQGIDFLAVVSNGQDTAMDNVTVRVDLLSEIIYKGDLKLEGSSYNGDIRTGINLGSLNPKTTKTLTFKGEIAPESSLSRNETDVMGTVSTSSGSSTDSVKIAFIRGGSPQTTTEKQGFLAGLLGVNISKPVYILLGIVIVILVIVAARRIIRIFKKED